jgi:asparagine synthase (glutamine-hydrolysing)
MTAASVARRTVGVIKARIAIPRIVREMQSARLTYLDTDALLDLHRTVRALERRGTPGAIVEAGTALGGSAIVMAAAKAARRPMFAFDTFGMIPPPSGRDGSDVHARYEEILNGDSAGIGGDVYYGYRHDLRAEVEASFARHGLPVGENAVSLVQGLYEETLHVQSDVALAHIDCDWYDSVTCCLERIVPRLVPGGRVIIDDYDAWSGCRQAVDDFLVELDGVELFRERRARLHLVRVA